MEWPAEFKEETRKLLGDAEYERLEEALERAASVSIRVNRKKQDIFGFLFSGSGLVDGKVPWCEEGYYLKQRPAFTFDPFFHAGSYYVQEASSMFIGQVVKKYIETPSVVLDLCAAPGGKSTQLCSLLPKESLLVANEVIRSRSQILLENLIKWGDPGIIVTRNDPKDFAEIGEFFDLILTDVPCSGEGMFRKDAAAVKEWSLENVTACRQRQRRILSDVWNCLKPGGILIYSTCTFNSCENEENIAWIKEKYGAEVLDVEVSPEWGITGNLTSSSFPVYRFLPSRSKGEGFFMAALRKKESVGGSGENLYRTRLKGLKEKRKGESGKKPVFPEEAQAWLALPERYSWISDPQENWIVFPTAYMEIYNVLRQRLNVLYAGIKMGSLKGKEIIPAHALAMSTILNTEAFFAVRVSYEEAIRYLRRETLTLDSTVPRGYILLHYQGVPIGFVKNIGNRANNLYPQEWKIRSGFWKDTEKVPDIFKKNISGT